MKYKSISKKQDESQLGKAKGESLPISFKKSVEFCRLLMGKKLSLAYKIIEEVKAMKTAVPFKRYNSSVAHKKGIGPGRFPIKTAIELEKMLKNAEKNATSKGLDANSLEIFHISADKGPTTYKVARHRGRVAKRTHIEIVLISRRSEKKDLKDIVSKTKKVSKEKTEKTNSSNKKISKGAKVQEESTQTSKKEHSNPESVEVKTVEKKTETQTNIQTPVKEDSKKEQNVKETGSENKNDMKKQKSQKNNIHEENHDQKESSLDKKEQKTDNPQGAKK